MKKFICIFLSFFISLATYSEKLQYFADSFSEFRTKWFSDVLNLLDPEGLFNSDSNGVRFTCLESMTRSYMVKVSWIDGDGILEVATESFPKDGERRIAFYKKINVPKKEIEELVKLISKTKFYKQASTEHSTGRDGYEWLFESKINGSYKAACRWCPEKGFMYELGNKLIDMAGERERFELDRRDVFPLPDGYTEIFNPWNIVVRLYIDYSKGEPDAKLLCYNISNEEVRIPKYYFNLTDSESNALKYNYFVIFDGAGTILQYTGQNCSPTREELESDVVVFPPISESRDIIEFDAPCVLNNYIYQPDTKYYIFYRGPLGKSTSFWIKSGS